VKEKPVALEIGKAEVVYTGAASPAEDRGHDVAIFGLGAMLPEAVRLAGMLEAEGLSVAVINPRFAKPVDRVCVEQFGRRAGLMITLEDHALAGGFGSAVLEAASDLGLSVPVVRIGWPDEFIEHGKVDQLREKYGLTAEAAFAKAKPYVAKMAEQLLARR
jgi:1-deoxy-D-xylulose-5-phosphate synthase